MSLVRHQLVPSSSLSVKENGEKPTTSHCDQFSIEGMTHSFFYDGKNLQNPQIIKKWSFEFLPRPEPPRFFRPLCSRLSRQNQILKELEQQHNDNTIKIIGETRRKMDMSIRQTRDEQKAQLREKRKKMDNKDKRIFNKTKNDSFSTSLFKKKATNYDRRSSSQTGFRQFDLKKSRKDLLLTPKNGIIGT
ncbi:hypothetical protein Mgra_00008414 [Meloidogyne graminicola]|uniref:Uncharacterized protein n=1 Tax=Meloidogyne graminicola TaxID=189291 RepID=A0A8S9ZFU8_9BILA|nr:hypothetical protein Mgra_00008414 [Meloidogyne graminicola]